MKKSKLLIVISLGVVLCMLTLTTNTFSWFSRPNTSSGNGLSYSESFDTSTGKNISMVTYESFDDGKTFDESSPVTDFSCTNLPPVKYLESESEFQNRKYYRTDIINSGDTAQTVSLYMYNLSFAPNSVGNFTVGVNYPLRTYKTYLNNAVNKSQRGSLVSVNKQNVYLGLHSDPNEMNTLTSREPYVHGWNNSGVESNCYWADRDDVKATGKYSIDGKWNNAEQVFNMYAMCIDSQCTNFMLFDKDTPKGYGGTQPSISSDNTIIFYEYGGTCYADARMSGTAAKMESYYKTADIVAGDSLSVKASGNNITYYSQNENIASVNKTSGLVTGKSAGTTKITAVSTGVYGDTIKQECIVTVYDSKLPAAGDFPIVTNIKIEPKTEDGDTKESVYWYILNDSNSNSLSYVLPDIYLTL